MLKKKPQTDPFPPSKHRHFLTQMSEHMASQILLQHDCECGFTSYQPSDKHPMADVKTDIKSKKTSNKNKVKAELLRVVTKDINRSHYHSIKINGTDFQVGSSKLKEIGAQVFNQNPEAIKQLKDIPEKIKQKIAAKQALSDSDLEEIGKALISQPEYLGLLLSEESHVWYSQAMTEKDVVMGTISTAFSSMSILYPDKIMLIQANAGTKPPEDTFWHIEKQGNNIIINSRNKFSIQPYSIENSGENSILALDPIEFYVNQTIVHVKGQPTSTITRYEIDDPSGRIAPYIEHLLSQQNDFLNLTNRYNAALYDKSGEDPQELASEILKLNMSIRISTLTLSSELLLEKYNKNPSIKELEHLENQKATLIREFYTMAEKITDIEQLLLIDQQLKKLGENNPLIQDRIENQRARLIQEFYATAEKITDIEQLLLIDQQLKKLGENNPLIQDQIVSILTSKSDALLEKRQQIPWYDIPKRISYYRQKKELITQFKEVGGKQKNGYHIDTINSQIARLKGEDSSVKSNFGSPKIPPTLSPSSKKSTKVTPLASDSKNQKLKHTEQETASISTEHKLE